MSIFLVTVLNCSQVNAVAQKLQGIALLTSKQKIEIVQELRKVVPSCPIIIKEK
jgi:hypothetical protein